MMTKDKFQTKKALDTIGTFMLFDIKKNKDFIGRKVGKRNKRGNPVGNLVERYGITITYAFLKRRKRP